MNYKRAFTIQILLKHSMKLSYYSKNR